MVACRPDWMAGKATLTAVPSINAMLVPRMVAASTQEPPPTLVGAEGADARITASSHGGLPIFAMTSAFLSASELGYPGFRFTSVLRRQVRVRDNAYVPGCSCIGFYVAGHDNSRL